MEIRAARDWYHLPLIVGDIVIPMCSEVLILGICGEIKKIYEDQDYQWLDIYDPETGKLHVGYNADNFSTQERSDELS